jgi:WhiB family redox-sensing transcriptional regulator
MSFDIKQATCLNEDPDMFFSDDEDEPDWELIKKAKAICALCPVIADCLQMAYEEEADGIWGGTTTRERRITLNREMRGYVPIPRTVSENAKQAVAAVNKAKTIAVSDRDRELFQQALDMFDDLDDLTEMLLQLRINNPTHSLADLGQELDPPISRDVVAGRLRRVRERMENGKG